MDYVDLAGTEISVSRLALGTWAFGGDSVWGDQDDRASVNTLSAALDVGVNFIDTAAGYAEGRSEQVVGRALQGRRDKAVVATKVGRTLSRDGVVEACEASLRRLSTDYIDVFYVHWPSSDHSLDETLAGMRALKETGKIRSAGICNFGPIWLSELAAARDADVVVVHQLPYSLFWRAIEFEILPATQGLGHSVVAYSTMAQGLLTGRYQYASQVPQGLHISRFFSDGPHGESGCEPEIFDALIALREECEGTGVSLPELAVQWVLNQPGIDVALTGARTPEEILGNASALQVKIESSLFEQATAIAEPIRQKLGSNPDMWKSAAESRFR